MNEQRVPLAETFGERLRRLRKERGLSQRQLACEGVTNAYISRLEHDRREASVKAIRKLAAKLDVTADYLETGKDNAVAELLAVATAARDWHDEHCGCEGEACEVGDALARLEAREVTASEVNGT